MARIGQVERGSATAQNSNCVELQSCESALHPLSALNPVLSVGQQLVELLQAHGRVSKREARERAIAQLREVGAVIAAEAGEGATSSGQYTGGDRSVLQGAAVHYVHGGHVWSAPWDAPEDTVGPQ